MVIYGRDDQPQLLVEVKAKKGASASWIKEMAEIVLGYEMLKEARFFLLALPDQLCLWPDPTRTIPAGKPPRIAKPERFLRPFAHGNSVDAGALNVTGAGLELLVAAWLDVLIDRRSSVLTTDDQRTFLEESGLLSAIQGGRLVVSERSLS